MSDADAGSVQWGITRKLLEDFCQPSDFYAGPEAGKLVLTHVVNMQLVICRVWFFCLQTFVHIPRPYAVGDELTR